MDIFNLPLPTEDFPSYIYTVALAGVNYRFLFSYLTRSWYLSILSVSEDLIISNIKLVPFVNLIGQYVDDNIPQGGLYLYPNNESVANCPEVTLESLATEFTLKFIPRDSL